MTRTPADTLQFVLQIPCHPTRHTALSQDPLAILDPVELGSVAGTMANTWSAAASILADLCGAGWDASGDAISSGTYVEVLAFAPAGVPYADSLSFAQAAAGHAEAHGMHVTLWHASDAVRMGDAVPRAAA
jgi:hypothetical protein